ncbi:MAG: hypothetical protein V4670_03190 [Bacteroidota bacterium]
MKTNFFTLFFCAISIMSYSQSTDSSEDESSLLKLGNLFSYSEEDSKMRLNYFLGKPEEVLPTQKYSINFINSETFLQLCNCKNELVNPLINELKVTAPNLVLQNDNKTDIRIEIKYLLETVLAPKMEYREISKVNTDLVYFTKAEYALTCQINMFKKNQKIATYTPDSYKIPISTDSKPTVDGAKLDWYNNQNAYIKRSLDYYDKTAIKKTINEALKADIPKTIVRLKELYLARYSKKNNKKHDFATSDEHLDNVQNYIKCEVNSVGINNIQTKCENFDKIIALKKIEEAVLFWKSQLQGKYAGITKFDAIRKGFAFNLLTSAFILKDKESYTFASKYIMDNKFTSKNLFSSNKDLNENYIRLQEQFLK